MTDQVAPLSDTPAQSSEEKLSLEELFVDAIKTCGTLRRRKRSEWSDVEAAVHSAAVPLIGELLERLLRAAGLMTVTYELREAKAIMCAVEVFLDVSDDCDLMERMALRMQEYEHHLARAEVEVAGIEGEERQALGRVLKRLARAELRRVEN